MQVRCSYQLSHWNSGIGAEHISIDTVVSAKATHHMNTEVLFATAQQAKYQQPLCMCRQNPVRVMTRHKGVWCLQNFDLDSSDSEVKEKVVSDFPTMQPENQSEFVLVKLSLGKE